uniref:Uncharacterized protein n=1 Tax=Timema cristinae TaxID=61476 RepID=A0A7R9CIS6_TIMCR|nr:unnamed protein product [Timema cristinae]
MLKRGQPLKSRQPAVALGQTASLPFQAIDLAEEPTSDPVSERTLYFMSSSSLFTSWKLQYECGRRNNGAICEGDISPRAVNAQCNNGSKHSGGRKRNESPRVLSLVQQPHKSLTRWTRKVLQCPVSNDSPSKDGNRDNVILFVCLGQLRVYQEGGWVSRHVEVNQGCLMVFSEDRSELQLRLPLRQLNLQPAGLPKTFSLGSCQQLPLAVFKVQGTLKTGNTIEELGRGWVLSPTIPHGGNELSHCRCSISQPCVLADLVTEVPTVIITGMNLSDNCAPNYWLATTLRRTIGYQDLQLTSSTCAKRTTIEIRIPSLSSPDILDHMVLPFQAGSQHQYDRWVKVLAVELLRQTSLEDIKFLDILAITATLGQAQEERGRARSRGVQSRRSHLSPGSDREVAALLAKCQQVESYVSVREKRRLFESLSRSNQRLAQSTDNLYTEELVLPEICGKKRAHSLHDLSRSSVAVKEMCRYFEERGRQDNVSRPNNVPELNNAFLSRRNAQRWERRLTRLKQQVADSEDRIWRLQGKMAGLDQQRESTSERELGTMRHMLQRERENLVSMMRSMLQKERELGKMRSMLQRERELEIGEDIPWWRSGENHVQHIMATGSFVKRDFPWRHCDEYHAQYCMATGPFVKRGFFLGGTAVIITPNTPGPPELAGCGKVEVRRHAATTVAFEGRGSEPNLDLVLFYDKRSSRLRGRDVRGYSVLERRLSEEEAKLNQLHEGASRALREVEHSSAKFETALIQ